MFNLYRVYLISTDRLVLRWVAPTLVLGGGGEETVHGARMGEDT